MAAVNFDTLRFTKRLTETGIPREQAEGIAEAFNEATGQELVTKTYFDLRISELRDEMHQADSSLRDEMHQGFADLRDEMHKSQTDIIKWMVGSQIAMIGAVTALVKLL